jgi:hypothetical protein
MKNKTLKNKIHKYISKNKDICCEDNVDRTIVINLIFEKYKKIAEQFDEPYLDYINNDLVLFIGFLDDLKKKKNIEGIKLWHEIDKKMYKNNNPNTKILDENNIKSLLQDLPLYYLLSFLGYGCYRAET